MHTAMTGFVAYPYSPQSVPDVIRAAVELINRKWGKSITTWEDLRIGGRVIIDQICSAIDQSEIFIADLTGFNTNVMYELGFAIARNKAIWLLYDDTMVSGKWTDLRLLSTIGYRQSTNSDQVIRSFEIDRPDQIQETIFQQHIQGSLRPTTKPFVFYIKSTHETNASTSITRRIEKSSIPRQVDDPREVTNQPLAWYAERVGSCEAIVCHLDSPSRRDSQLRNATVALIAGLAHGLNKKVLLLTEGDHLAPLDYRDRLRSYTTSKAAFEAIDGWMAPLEEDLLLREVERQEAAQSRVLHTELRGLQIGEYIAENEVESLLSDYFVETAAYHQALQTRNHNLLFVGRKGAGKSATYLKLSQRLREDHRNIVCEIKPPSYELTSLMSVLAKFTGRDQKQFVVEGLWRFLLYTEIADQIVSRIEAKPVQSWSPMEDSLCKLHRDNRSLFAGDFALRLEQITAQLELVQPEKIDGIADFRRTLANRLYGDLIGQLRSHLASAVPKRSMVRVLVDNLDKAWEQSEDLALRSEFLLGLLSATTKLANEFSGALEEHKTGLSLVVFLRSDIFDRIRKVAREPDKLIFSRLDWNDPEMLLRLVDERYRAFEGDDVVPRQIWRRFFCPTVQGKPTPDFVLQTTLPRPRDLIFFLRVAISIAINRQHTRVEEQDIREAVRRYSEFAFDALRIEDLSYDEPVADSLIELAGQNEVLDGATIMSAIRNGSPVSQNDNDVLARLCLLSFLTVETRDGEFSLIEDANDLRKSLVLASALGTRRGTPIRYRIHPAYQRYLEIQQSLGIGS